MSARRRSSGIRVAVLGLLCAALASGCVSLQQDGTVTRVGEQDAGAAQVQIWPSPPGDKETASEIVSGFLEAARSGATNQDIAADYLTPAMRKTWQAEQNTVIVLADYSEGTPQELDAADPDGTADQDGPAERPGSDSGGTVVEQVQGTLLGRLAGNGLYTALSGTENYNFTLEHTAAGYRIAALPDGFGVLMERSDFESFYTRHVVYFENPQASEQGWLLPAQVYLPSVDTDEQVADQAAKLVVNGVPPQLASQMQNAVDGVKYVGMQTGSDGAVTVTVNSSGHCAQKQDCYGLAQQLAQTLGRLNPKITAVAVKDTSSGHTSAQATPDEALTDYGNAPQPAGDGVHQFYAISLTGQVEQLDTTGTVVDPNVLKDTKDVFGSVTAGPNRGGQTPELALVGKDGSTLSVARRRGGVWQATTVYPAASGSPSGGSIGRAGWDSTGNLWFTVTHNGVTSVYHYGSDSLDQVTLSGLDGTVDAVLPAPDDDRVAVRFTAADGTQSIVIAAVTETDGGYALDLSGAEYAVDGWNSITDFDWYDEESLAVLGTQPGSQSLGLYEIYSDGSAVYDSLTSQPVQASPPAQAASFIWTAAGHPIAASPNNGKSTLYLLSVEGQDAQPLGSLTGSSPTY